MKAQEQGLEFEKINGGYKLTKIGQTAGTKIVIPVTYQGLPVLEIAMMAFCFNKEMTDVVIPSSVINISIDSPISRLYYAMNEVFVRTFQCFRLKNIKVDKDNPNYKDIDGNLYTKDGKTLIRYANGKKKNLFLVPSSVKVIADGAFSNCKNLKGIEFSNGLSSVGLYAFYGCTNLIGINLPNTVTSIGYRIFWGCENLTSVKMPNALTEIGEQAFKGCRNLTYVNLPSDVTSIGKEAFSGCESLKNIVLPNSITSIGEDALFGCVSLAEITIPANVTSIGKGAFDYCKSLKGVYIPKRVTSIGKLAFSDCRALTEIKVDKANEFYKDINGDLYTKDGKTLLQYAIGKENTSFVIPSGVTTIESFAFAYAKYIENVVVPSNVTKVAICAFGGCENLTSVVFKNIKGWVVQEHEYETWEISAKDLSDSETAAQYVTETYSDCDWEKQV